METIRNKEVLKAMTSKNVKTTASEGDKASSDDDSSASSSEDINFRGFSREEKDALERGGFYEGFMEGYSYYRDFTACDVPKFTGNLNLIVSTRRITAIEGNFHTSECEDKNKVNFATNFHRDSVKIWWEGKMCEKGKDEVSSCSWKEFKEMFNAKYAPVEEIDKIRKEFHSLIQTNETENEL
nr:zinc finger, CCHC-type, retrotransposon Gag domain protein [Tanacetum cinerariifolium]